MEWFLCLGCGKRAAYFPDGHVHPDHTLPPGAVAHDKPGCSLYKRLSCSEFAAMHAQQPRLPQPDKIEPIVPPRN